MEPSQNVTSDPMINDPMRGFKSFPWMDRAMDPNSSALKDSGKVHTASSNVDGKELLYPTVRLNEKGVLQEYSPLDAQRLAIEKDDFLSFDTPEQATAWSKDFSDKIPSRELPPQLKKVPESLPPQIPATTPDETSIKYQELLDYATNISKADNSLEAASMLVFQMENGLEEFDLNEGVLGGLDPKEPFQFNDKGVLSETTILKELEKRFPVNDSTPGAILIQNYLKERINRDNRDNLYRGPRGGL